MERKSDASIRSFRFGFSCNQRKVPREKTTIEVLKCVIHFTVFMREVVDLSAQ